MDENSPTLEEWRKLYEAASRVKELAPWQWMGEMDVFGVQDPETGELGFVSVMGAAGEHYAVAVYLGAEGLYGFWAMEQLGSQGPPEVILGVPQIQASFEDRDVLRDQDRSVIKQLGLKFRGRQAWPWFRSFRPACVPWFLEGAEARFLTYALEQTAEVAPRFKEDPSLLETDDEVYLVRTPHEKDGLLTWEDQTLHVPPVEPEPIELVMDLQLLKRVKRLAQRVRRVELDFYVFMAPVQEGKGTRPFYPFNLMIVESESGMILAGELVEPKPTLEAAWGQIPLRVLQVWDQLGFQAEEVRVRTPVLEAILQPLANELRFKVRVSRRLPKLDEAKAAMEEYFG